MAMESVAVIEAADAGVKVIPMVHELSPASDAPQVLVEMANAFALVPFTVAERVMAALLLFVSVTVIAALVVPTP